jgi:hypothetical protein
VAAVSLSYRSVGSSDLYLRQVPRPSERRGHEVESRSNLGSSRHPWRRTSAFRRVPVSRLEAPAAVGRTLSMKDLIRRRATYRRVRPDLVVPVFEPHQGGAESTMVERDALVPKPLFLEGADEPFLDGNSLRSSLRRPEQQATVLGQDVGGGLRPRRPGDPMSAHGGCFCQPGARTCASVVRQIALAPKEGSPPDIPSGATCKPKIRAGASVGDWIIGTGAKSRYD